MCYAKEEALDHNVQLLGTNQLARDVICVIHRASKVVQITAVKIRTERIEMKRGLSRHMRAVNDGNDTRRACPFDNFFNRENKRGRRSNMTEKNNTRARRHTGPKRINEGLFGS